MRFKSKSAQSHFNGQFQDGVCVNYPSPAPDTSWRPRAAYGSRQGNLPQARNSQDSWKTPWLANQKRFRGTLWSWLLQVFLASAEAVSVETAVVAICSEAMEIASQTFQPRVGRNAWNFFQDGLREHHEIWDMPLSTALTFIVGNNV